MADYTSIDRPYDNLMSRGTDTVESDYVGQKDESYAGQTSPQGSGGAVETQPVKEGGSIDDLWINTFIRSKNWKPRAQGFTIDGETGYAEFSNVFVTGGIAATTGSIGGWTIAANEIYSGNVHLNSSNQQITLGSATGPLTGDGIFIGLSGGEYHFRAGDPSGGYMHWDGTLLSLVSATLTAPLVTSLDSGSMLSIQGWQFSGVFSASDSDTVAWGAGTLSFPDGQTFAIGASNTGNIAALTYIYFDKAASTTALQTTTTAATAVGTNKVLLAVAQNNADATKEATFQVFGGAGGVNPFITADNIAANTITADEIAANTITAGELNVTQLSAITADMGTLTAGTITLPSGGHVKSGQTAYDTGTGFWLGNDAGTPKFSIGDSAADKLLWTGTALEITGNISGSDITGSTITGGLIQTSATGERVVIDGTNDEVRFYNGTTLIGSIDPDLTGTITGLDILMYDDTPETRASLEMYTFDSDSDSRAELSVFDTTGDEKAKVSVQNDEVGGFGTVELTVGSSLDGIDIEYNVADDRAEIDINGVFVSDLDPDGNETRDIGDDGIMWDQGWIDWIHYNILTDESDIRLKENIESLPYGLDAINNLNPVSFNWKKNGRLKYGFIAQEVQEVIPEMVSPVMKKVLEGDETVEVIIPAKRGKNGKMIPAKKKVRKNKDRTVTRVPVKHKDDPEGDPILQLESLALLPILVRAVQELSKKVGDLESELEKTKGKK